jgi:hypothetical protein
MIWNPRKGAFRVGASIGSEWEDAQLGAYSMGLGNNAVASGAGTVALGTSTRATDDYSMAMGYKSEARAPKSIAIGDSSIVSGNFGIALGALNAVSGTDGIAVGLQNAVSFPNGLAIGIGNSASNNQAVAIGSDNSASGLGSTAIGVGNSAGGAGSLALGNYANTSSFAGAIVISDFSTATNTTASANNEFTVRAAGGTRIFSSSDLSTGVTLAAGGGSWTSVSDRNRKMNFRDLDGEDVLARLRNVPVTEWSYIAQGSSIRHIGPMAQDFFAAFRLGSDDVTITSSDIDGVNLAAVQALIERSDRLKEENAALRSEVTELRTRLERLEALERRLEALEKRVP